MCARFVVHRPRKESFTKMLTERKGSVPPTTILAYGDQRLFAFGLVLRGHRRNKPEVSNICHRSWLINAKARDYFM
jgi:hypothetical protein